MRGKYLTEKQKADIHRCLLTSMSMNAIALRLGLSLSTVQEYNQQQGIRHYNGLHKQWYRDGILVEEE